MANHRNSFISFFSFYDFVLFMHIPQITGICRYIPRYQSNRILYNTECPFQAQFLHPLRCPGYCSCFKFKRRPYSKHYAIQLTFMCRHPFFLLGRPQCNPYKIRSGIINLIYNILIFLCRQFPEWWGIHSYNTQPGIFLF